MGTWTLIQVVFNIFVALGLFVVIMRMNRAPKDDPRLSRGLQLLQSKIAVLEDLSDRTEMQVNQLTAILDQKSREVQAKVQLAEQHVHAIKVSMERSLDVAKIFQDKIPHQEIIERKNTIKYVQAARMAHQGMSVEEIVEKVGLPKGEVEFIAKVNRDRLMFSEEQLPSWALQDSADAQNDDESRQNEGASSDETDAFGVAEEENQNQAGRLRAEMELAEQQRLVENLSRLQFEMQNLDIQLAKESAVRDLSGAFEVPRIPTETLQKLGEEFRKACEAAERGENSPAFPQLDQLAALIPQVLFSADEEDRPVIHQPQVNVVPNEKAKAPPSISASVAAPEAGPTAAAVAVAATQPQQQMAPVATHAAPLSQAQPQQTKVNPDLAAARAMAMQAAAPQPFHLVNASGKKDGTPPVVRKVQFPKIDGPGV